MVYPVDKFVNFEGNKRIWFEWLTVDPAYLHSVLLATSTLNDFMTTNLSPNDFMVTKIPAKATYFHLKKAITFLNDQLSNTTVLLRDSSVAVVITLSSIARLLGDNTAADTHLTGLDELVRLGGGVDSFRENTKLHIKLCRYIQLSTHCPSVQSQPHLTLLPVSI